MANKMGVAFYIAFCSSLFVVVTMAHAEPRLACAGVPDGRFIRDVKSCSHYYLCKNHAIVDRGRCPEGLLFSDVDQLCNYPGAVKCNSCVQYGRPYFANPLDQTIFFRCVDGIRHTYRCSHGKVFDEISNRCQRKYNIGYEIDDGDVPPIASPNKPSANDNNNNEWPMPEGVPTRAPPTWGPPKPPQGGEGDDSPPAAEPEEEETPTRPPRNPGGIGTWRPTTDPDAEQTKPTKPPRQPWGPPDAPAGSSY